MAKVDDEKPKVDEQLDKPSEHAPAEPSALPEGAGRTERRG